MSQFYDQASLVVVPSGYKAGTVYAQKPLTTDGQLAFTRTGDTATRVNSAGLIERVRTNLLVQSQNLAAAAWSLGGTATRTANYGTAPDGTQTSTRIQWTSAASFELYQYTGLSAPIYGSVYIKGTAGQTIKYTGNSVTLNGSWQRIEGFIAIDGANTYFTIAGTAGANTAFDFELWGAQAETGDVATAYIPTTTAAVSVGPVANVPRLDYLGSTCPRLLLEPQRTNLVTYSEQFNNAAYIKVRTSVTANATISPDGYTNADKIESTASTGQAVELYQAITTSAQAYTASVFLKQGSGATDLNKVDVYFLGTGTYNASVNVNLSTGVLTQTVGTGASVVNYGNGWYRVLIPFTAGSGSTAIYVGSDGTHFANGTFVYAYGLQLEAGAYATSYIPTLAASATRGADACSKTGVAGLIGDSAGFIYGEVQGLTNTYGALNGILSVSDGTFATNSVTFYFNAVDGYLTPRIFRAGSSIFVADYPLGSLTNTFKFVISYGGSRAVCYINGTKIQDVSGLTFFADGTLTRVALDRGDGVAPSNSKISQVLIGTAALTDAQCIELTTL